MRYQLSDSLKLDWLAKIIVIAVVISAIGCRPQSSDLLNPLPADQATYIPQNIYTPYSADAFSQPLANLMGKDRGLFAVGNSFFTNAWITAPASATARDGLGPLFSASACQDCHIRDGRGHIPSPTRIDGRLISPYLGATSIRIADPGSTTSQSHGSHLQLNSIAGIKPDASLEVEWFEKEIEFDDKRITLRRPSVRVNQWYYQIPTNPITTSLRIAPMVAGTGLIESITAADLKKEARMQASKYPGLAGTLPVLEDGEIGRFGWKANQPDLSTQSLDAFNKDMGLTSEMFPTHDCTETQLPCYQRAKQETSIDVSQRVADAVVFYLRHLTLPNRRQLENRDVIAGAKLFEQLQCNICHRPAWQTKNAQISELDNLTIYPFSDFLLHDMGSELADDIAEGAANGRQWRTTPLWGLGYVKGVGGEFSGYLHDGRAQTIEEAILWHGGQAAASNKAYQSLTKTQRRHLIRFLASL